MRFGCRRRGGRRIDPTELPLELADRAAGQNTVDGIDNQAGIGLYAESAL